MLFSVIIPTYNRLELLRQTLESVWTQTFTDFEVIVVDDGSTDGTLDFLNGYESKITVVRQLNAGPGAARNAGAKNAIGKYLIFLDSDDLWFSWTLETIRSALDVFERPSILCAAVKEFREPNELKSVQPNALKLEIFPDYLAASSTGYYVGSGMAVILRDAFVAAGGFILDPINGEDHDLTLKLGCQPGFVQVLEPITLAWRRHSKSATADIVKAIAGAKHLLAFENKNNYPGGKQRRSARREIISRHVRPVALACLRGGAYKQAWALYYSTFFYHIELRRWKFLIGFPFQSAFASRFPNKA